MTTLDRVKELCKSRGISVKRLEEKLEIPNNTIYQWKRITPSLDKLQKVADFFDVSVDYLLGRTNVKRFEEPETIAAHHVGDDWTEEEIEELERFKEFIRSKRGKKG